MMRQDRVRRRARGAASLLALASLAAGAVDVPVSDVAGLQAAIASAVPGDTIVLAAGTYPIPGNLTCSANGTAQLPIRVIAAQPRSVLLRFTGAGTAIVEGFRVTGAHWRFEGLDIEGACVSDSACEHAFHLIGGADFSVIRNSVVRDFNAQIKSNGAAPGSSQFPDDVLIEGNRFHDTRARNTSNPVTKIDVVGGRRWVVRANAIHDFQKLLGDNISYGAFLKGNSRNGVFERNLVTCSRDFTGGVRLGLSFGGGGTAPASVCEDLTCTPEHQDGLMRNNLILACNDVGIYLNRAARSQIHHNALYDTTGIDVRFVDSTADLRNNLVSGSIRNRDGGSSTQAGNLTAVGNAPFQAWFVDPANADFRLLDGSTLVDQGVSAPLVFDDYCGNLRDDGLPDRGAVEFDAQSDCDTRVAGGAAPRIFADGFESG